MRSVVLALAALFTSAAFASPSDIDPRRPGGHGRPGNPGWGQPRAFECVASRGFGPNFRTFRRIDRFEGRARQEAFEACMRSDWGSGRHGDRRFNICNVRCKSIPLARN